MSFAGVTEWKLAMPEDAMAVRDLVRAAYAKWVPLLGREPMPMKADYNRAVREHRIDLLLVGGEMRGLIETMLREDHLWIENVAVLPEAQGAGLGRLLLAQAERLAADAGRTELRLLTSSAFAANVALYEKIGYRTDRLEPFMGGTTVYMSKRVG
ncbi:GNAT family N-acetyltransferase [Dongia sp.]|uniref:GNAT family N-acetyltransferase n=1 Tax=Dongia sp. TaxID=1977262 RepID=UPI0035B0F2F2